MLMVGIPVLVVLVIFSAIHNVREIRLVQKQTQIMVAQLGQVLRGSLQHEMLKHDEKTIQQILESIARNEAIDLVEMVNSDGEVTLSSNPEYVGKIYTIDQPGCEECHSLAPEERPSVRQLSSSVGTLRMAAPIENTPECQSCHGTEVKHLGVLLIDAPLASLEEHIREDMRLELFLSLGIVIILSAYIYWQVYWAVIHRVEAMQPLLQAYAQGDFSVRLPAKPKGDSLNALALAFNNMADELQRHTEKEAKRLELHRQVIVEERERIARELHDGFAQLLSYASTKVAATRLFLERGQVALVAKNLDQIDEVIQQMFVDVREAIVGLRMAGDLTLGLAQMLTEYAQQFCRLSNFPVNVRFDPIVDHLDLPPEAEVQLLRISQEALSNVRKHAQAKRVEIDLSVVNGDLVLSIADDGVGFEVDKALGDNRSQFGLCTMRERAASIGGKLTVESQPGEGTRVIVRVPVNGKGTADA